MKREITVNGNVITLHDPMEWNNEELDKWCEINGCRRQGSTVVVPDEHRITLFVLYWS
jgi:hypothetical protein